MMDTIPLNPDTLLKGKSKRAWDVPPLPPAKRRSTASPPAAEIAEPALASMTTLASPASSHSPLGAPSAFREEVSPPNSPYNLPAEEDFDQGDHFWQGDSDWKTDSERSAANPAMGWTRKRLSWWNPQWVWDRAAINKPDGGYCETCVGDYAASDYEPLETRSFGGFGLFCHFDRIPEPFKAHDTWIDPDYRDDPEQQRPWYDGNGRPYRASKEYKHEDRWTDSDPEGPVGNWPSQRPTFAGRRGAAAQKLFDELLELRQLKELREERVKLQLELEEMQRGLKLMASKAEHLRRRADEMERECARIKGHYPPEGAESLRPRRRNGRRRGFN